MRIFFAYVLPGPCNSRMVPCITASQFDGSAEELLALLRLDLGGFVKGLCRRGYNDTIYITASVTVLQGFIVDFIILFDRFYTVPVLYFHISGENIPSLSAPGFTDWIVTHLGARRAAWDQNVALDVNPVSHTVAWYIHPCETNATLSKWHGVETPLQYLCIWFNLYGLPALFPQIQFRPLLVL